MGRAPATAGRTYPFLDALRGIAALVILLGHLVKPFDPLGVPNGSLAVDFFFLLGGFVLAHAYDARLAQRRLSVRDFLRARLIRLYPMLFLGTCFGAGVLLARIALSADWPSLPSLLAAFLLGVLIVPSHVLALSGYDTQAFPLDLPVWSLCFVFIVNAAYAASAPVLRTRWMALITGIGALGLLRMMVARGGSYTGSGYATFLDGGWRVLFAFAAGVLIFRLRGHARGGIDAVGAAVLAALLALVLLLPVTRHWLYHAACLFGVFPAVVVLGSFVSIDGWAERLSLVLGRLSYPVFAVQYPMVRVACNFARAGDLHGGALWLAQAGAGVAIVLCAAICLITVDEPLRSALTRRARPPMPSVGTRRATIHGSGSGRWRMRVMNIGRRRLLGAAIGLTALVYGAAPAAAADYKVALVLTGSVSDGGWNQQAYEGLKGLTAKGGFATKYSENVKQSEIPQVVRGYADDGYDLVIGHGFQFGSLFMEVGPEYPKQKFFATTFAPNGAVPANVMFVNTRPYDVAYCMGALAALLSKKHGVGLVGGGDNPTQQTMSRVFKAGAEATVPGLKAFAVVTGDYNDAAKGRETALAMIGNGADVITHTADLTGIGAIKGASEAKAVVIGAFSDQTALAPDLMATSIVNDNAAIITMVADMGKSGAYKGGTEWAPDLASVWYPKYGAAEYNEKVVPAATWATFKAIWADVASGKIDTKPLTK